MLCHLSTLNTIEAIFQIENQKCDNAGDDDTDADRDMILMFLSRFAGNINIINIGGRINNILTDEVSFCVLLWLGYLYFSSPLSLL